MLFYQIMLSFNFYFFSVLYIGIILCSHRICMCTIFSFYTLIGSFELPGFAHPGLNMLPYWTSIWRGSHALWGAGVSYLIILSRYLFFLILIDSVILCILNSAFIPFRLFMKYYIMCGNLYVILQWYLIPS